MKIDDKIRNENLQYIMNRETSIWSSSKFDKYE